MKKIFLVLGLILIIGLGAVMGYLKFGMPDLAPAPELTVERTPERIKKGEYLAMHVAACMDCHSSRDWTIFSAPLVEGTLGKGGEYFGPEMGFPGEFYSRNLTPANLGNWTDGEIFRAITSGVNKDGEALFPVMPYLSYGKMDKEDIYSIIAYLRTLPAVDHHVMASEAGFPMNFIMNTLPAEPQFVQRPDTTDVVKYGAYLVGAASCIDCHTQVDKGQIMPELAFSGGREFPLPAGTVRSANITPDKDSGIGKWSEGDFVYRFKKYQDINKVKEIDPSEFQTMMPWTMYAGMDTTDLKAIYAYLNTLKPISNQVEQYTKK